MSTSDDKVVAKDDELAKAIGLNIEADKNCRTSYWLTLALRTLSWSF
ncbi:hypothetical protein IM793_18345 [Pedobacter sp. MR2016-19]|nr:hypothetical protein [Pedobacter sp. MR2016-19]